MTTTTEQPDTSALSNAAVRAPRRTVDGRAYGLPEPAPDDLLVRVGPGTPGGELLRRYWHPIAHSKEIGELPREIRVLGEDLIIYRDKQGTVGLLYPRCVHRGTTLLYGKVEDNGIRCCYHGWLFDAEGHCVEMPCEPDNARVLQNVRQPWYPVVEKWGLVFTYMGPADQQPEMPHFDFEDDLAEDEAIVGSGSMDAPDDDVRMLLLGPCDYNWWQFYDNFMDPFHVYVLHSTINGVQFQDDLTILPKVTFEYTADGVRSIQHRQLPDGRTHQRISQVILPNINSTASVAADLGATGGVSWTVPRDDTSFRHFAIMKNKTATTFSDVRGPLERLGILQPEWGPGRPVRDWTLEDHQRWQTDYIAQRGQGEINLHSEEHLTSIDRGTAMMRRFFRRAAIGLSEGEQPVGAVPGETQHIAVTAGNGILAGDPLVCVDGYDGR